jgi:hypothetical protein
MATKHTSPCLKKAGDDETIFVLRAQDVTSPIIVLEWIKANFETCPNDKLMKAFESALSMKDFKGRKSAD